MSNTVVFSGTYTQNQGEAVAAGTVSITPYGQSTTVATLDGSGHYSVSVAFAGQFTIVETLTGVAVRTFKVTGIDGAVVDTGRDIGTVQGGSSGSIGAISGLQAALNAKLAAASNLSDVGSPSTALTNIGGATAAAVATNTTNIATNTSAIATETTRATTAENLKLAKNSNLSDVANPATALANLGGQAVIAAGTYAKPKQSRFMGGRRWLFAGDSITNASNATNFVYSYSRQACHMSGTLYVASDSIEGGTTGYTSTQLLTFMPTLLSTYNPDGVHIQIGTNDSGNAVSLATFSANIQAIVALCKAASVPITLGTVPPRTSASTAARPYIAAYNLWLRLWAPGQGIELADVHGALVDPLSANGDMLATYNTSVGDGTGGAGDGVHPNNLGHTKIAQVVAAAMLRTYSTSPPNAVWAPSSVGLLPNPLMATSGTDPTSSFGDTATGTAPTRSIVSDTSGQLPAGKWAQVDLDATSGAGVFARAWNVASAWSVGDTIVLLGWVQIEDTGGTWLANTAAGTADVAVQIKDGSSGLVKASAYDRCAGRPITPGSNIYSIGPFLMPYIVGAGITSLTVRYLTSLPTGAHVKARFGCLQMLNLTTLGLTGYSVAAMSNVDGP